MANETEAWPPRTHFVRFLNWLENKGPAGIPALSFFCGALLATAFAPFNIFPALFVAVPLFILLAGEAKTGKAAFVRGWWGGFGFFSIGLHWIGHSFTQQEEIPLIVAPFAMFALTGLLAIYIGLTFWVSWRMQAKGVRHILVFAASWTLMEYARGTFFTGFPWNLLGSAWAEWLYPLQGAHWFSVYGLSFITALGAGALALLFAPGRVVHNIAFTTLLSAILPLMALAGYFRVADEQPEYHLDVSLKVVQANVRQRDKWRPHLIDGHFDNHMELSRGDGGTAEGSKLLIWPETAVQRQSFDRDNSLLRWRLSRLLEYGNYAITGAPRYAIEEGELRYYNSVFALNSKGSLFARYDKNHLVPFGEYMPFASLFNAVGLKHLTEGGAFSPGSTRETLVLPGVPGFSPLVCYETIFPGDVLSEGPRPQWLLNLSNDAWFGRTGGPYQHLAQARMRAVEEGLPMVRSTSTGISAVIDGYGRTVSSLAVGVRGVLESPLPRALVAPAVATRTKISLFMVLSLAVLLVSLLMHMRAERTRAELGEVQGE
jgi:apolipoprotein N-acyltransferase